MKRSPIELFWTAKNETWPVQSRSSLMQQQQKQPENVHLSGSHNWPIFNICIFDHFNWRDLMLCKCGIKSQKNTTNISQIALNCLKQSGNLCLFPKEKPFGWIQNCKKSSFWKLQANATDVLHHIYSCFLLLGKSLPAQHRCLLCSSTYLCDLSMFILQNFVCLVSNNVSTRWNTVLLAPLAVLL